MVVDMNLGNLFFIMGKLVDTILTDRVYRLRNKHGMLEKGQYDFFGGKPCSINLLHFFEESFNM